MTTRDRVAKDTASRRKAEQACALDFRVYGAGVSPEEARVFEAMYGLPVLPVSHADRCVCSPRCSSEYELEGEIDEILYADTGIGALYGLPGPKVELEGWTVTRRSS